jgi:hypothetical protein
MRRNAVEALAVMLGAVICSLACEEQHPSGSSASHLGFCLYPGLVCANGALPAWRLGACVCDEGIVAWTTERP